MENLGEAVIKMAGEGMPVLKVPLGTEVRDFDSELFVIA